MNDPVGLDFKKSDNRFFVFSRRNPDSFGERVFLQEIQFFILRLTKNGQSFALSVENILKVEFYFLFSSIKSMKSSKRNSVSVGPLEASG